MSEEQLTEEEKHEIAEKLNAAGYGYPQGSEKHNVHTFLEKVRISTDTTKVGYLKEEELGMPNLPVRTFKELELFSKKIADKPLFAEYFGAMSEITTATSLSRDAKLLDTAVTQSRKLTDIIKRPEMRENKGWFGKKKTEVSQGE